jgi:diguanylate cyclase (GGDEF)-like protein
MADYLQRCTREADLIARYEGDQFVIALSATANQALAVAQRILTGLRRATFEGGGAGLRLTATLGVAAFPDHGLTAKELFTSAQAALKTAKAKGRNQCLLHQEVRAKADQVGAASDSF